MKLFRTRLTAGLQNPKDRSSSFSRVIRRVESELSYLRTIRASWLHGHVSRHHRTHTSVLGRRHYSLDRERHADAIDPPRLDLLGWLLEVLQERVVPVPTSAKRGNLALGKTYLPPKAMTSRCLPRLTHSNMNPPRKNCFVVSSTARRFCGLAGHDEPLHFATTSV